MRSIFPFETRIYKRKLSKSEETEFSQKESSEMPIGIIIWMFIKGPGDRVSIPDRVIRKTQKMVIDAALLNTQHQKVRIKGKWSSSGKGVTSSPTPKEPWGRFRLCLANLYIYIYIYIYIMLSNHVKIENSNNFDWSDQSYKKLHLSSYLFVDWFCNIFTKVDWKIHRMTPYRRLVTFF